MNNRDLLKAIGDIDDQYLIEETDIEERNRITYNKIVNIIENLKLKYILVPICMIAITFIGVYKSGIFTSDLDIDIANEDNEIIKEVQIDNRINERIDIANKDNWIIKEVEVQKEISESIARVPKWDEMSISQQFMQVQYNDNKYISKITQISSDNIQEYIGDSILTGYDAYTKTTYEQKGELYSIKNLSDKCAIAVKFEGDTDYYVYLNLDYRPTTLGEFMNDLNLKEITSFGTIYYNYWEENSEGTTDYKHVEFYDVDNKIIWDMLFSDINMENIYNDADSGKYTSERWCTDISISVNIPLLGYKNISVSLTDKGYLLTNILDTGKGFYIGEDKVQEFLNYIKENYDGYQIVYVEKNDDKIVEEKNMDNNKILMIENKTKDSKVVEVVVSTENKIKLH